MSLQTRDVDADGELIGVTFDPSQGEAGRVKLLLQQSVDSENIQLREFAVYNYGCDQGMCLLTQMKCKVCVKLLVDNTNKIPVTLS